jgi:hypothetical protein
MPSNPSQRTLAANPTARRGPIVRAFPRHVDVSTRWRIEAGSPPRRTASCDIGSRPASMPARSKAKAPDPVGTPAGPEDARRSTRPARLTEAGVGSSNRSPGRSRIVPARTGTAVNLLLANVRQPVSHRWSMRSWESVPGAERDRRRGIPWSQGPSGRRSDAQEVNFPLATHRAAGGCRWPRPWIAGHRNVWRPGGSAGTSERRGRSEVAGIRGRSGGLA